ncbi:MAG: hypothetical protein EOO71_03030 [Myxococcaceae bacterium]|nr:MAG: hypothetical protein EOO71_03030 [Myxococcaceae bacterium]
MHQRVIGYVCCVGLIALSGCAGPDEETLSNTKDTPQGPIAVTFLTGETAEVDASKVCWETLTPIPKGSKVVSDIQANRMLFVPESTDTSRPEMYLAPVEEGGGSVTCKCTSGSGGCSPAKVGSDVGCVMTTCSACSKS